MRCQVNSVRACGCGNIGAIVYQQFSPTAAGNLGRAGDQFIQYFGRQVFFADLNQIDVRRNCGFDKLEDLLEVFTAGRRRWRRLAAADEVADWLCRTVHISYRWSRPPVVVP